MFHSEEITRITPNTAPDLNALCSEYRAHGWWVDGNEKTGRISLVVGGSVSALLMPAELGAKVHRVLSIHMLAGPVLAYPAERQWAFLAEPDTHRDGLPPDVAAWKVTDVRPGTWLRLPMPRPRPHDVCWIDSPEPHRPTPPWQAVVSATRRAMSDMTLDHPA
jgi:hypothetical protein